MAASKGIIKTALRLLLLVPLALLVLWVNYFVDQTGLFRGGKYELELAGILMQGDPVSNFDQMDERQVLKLYIKSMPQSYDTLVIGSSRGLQITADIAGERGSFYNAGMSGEDFYDIMGTVSLLDKYDRLPKNLILVLDPWILNDNEESYSKRSDANLANEFLTNTLGFDEPYEDNAKNQYTDALFDLDYFQKNVSYYFEDHSNESQPARVTGDVYEQDTPTKMPDGTLLYEKEYREWTQADVDWEAQTIANIPFPFGCYDYPQLNEKRCAEFTALVAFLQQKGVSLTFVLSPFHPIVYASAIKYEERAGIGLSETFFKGIAQKNDIPFYGSYDPAKAGCTSADFYDGLHIKRGSISKYFPGIQAAATAGTES